MYRSLYSEQICRPRRSGTRSLSDWQTNIGYALSSGEVLLHLA